MRLYDAGYLAQARQSLDISRYAFDRGAGSLLDWLDATRAYRTVEFAYRDALAKRLRSLQSINFALGKVVFP